MKMQCIDPTNFEDWQLEEYADGEESPGVAEHISSCPACESQLAEIRQFNQKIRGEIFRYDCPSTDTLRDFLLKSVGWQKLTSTEQVVMERHTQTCPHCIEELAIFKTYIGEESTVQSPVSAVIENISKELAEQVRAISDQMQVAIASLTTPQLAGSLRGPKSSLVYTTEEDVVISITLHNKPNECLDLDGLLLTDTKLSEVTFKLFEDKTRELIWEGDVSSAGKFSAQQLIPGTYQLVLKASDKVIIIPNLELA